MAPTGGGSVEDFTNSSVQLLRHSGTTYKKRLPENYFDYFLRIREILINMPGCECHVETIC